MRVSIGMEISRAILGREVDRNLATSSRARNRLKTANLNEKREMAFASCKSNPCPGGVEGAGSLNDEEPLQRVLSCSVGNDAEFTPARFQTVLLKCGVKFGEALAVLGG